MPGEPWLVNDDLHYLRSKAPPLLPNDAVRVGLKLSGATEKLITVVTICKLVITHNNAVKLR